MTRPVSAAARNKIGLPAKKCRDLQHIDDLAGNLRFRRRMHIRCHGNFQFLPDRGQKFASFARTDSAITNAPKSDSLCRTML